MEEEFTFKIVIFNSNIYFKLYLKIVINITITDSNFTNNTSCNFLYIVRSDESLRSWIICNNVI